MRKLVTFAALAILPSMVLVLMLAGTLMAGIASATTINVNPGDDLDAKANAAGPGDTILVHASPNATPQNPTTYVIDNKIKLKSNQSLVGDPGTSTRVGPAIKPHPVVRVVLASGANQNTLIRPEASGQPIRISWLELDAKGVNQGITAIAAGSGLHMDHLYVHGAAGSGIGQARGVLVSSELAHNGQDASKVGNTAAGIKCNFACEVNRVVTHDNGGNGVWCDVGCQSEAARINGFWVHNTVTYSNSRHGIFYENALKPDLNPGDHVKALIEHNRSYGNAYSGISVSDSAYGTVRYNVLGQSVSGRSVHNGSNDGIELHASGDPSRGTQYNATIMNNVMKGETIKATGEDGGCGWHGNVCTSNTP